MFVEAKTKQQTAHRQMLMLLELLLLLLLLLLYVFNLIHVYFHGGARRPPRMTQEIHIIVSSGSYMAFSLKTLAPKFGNDW